MAESIETGEVSAGGTVEVHVGELLNDYLDRRARGEQISEEVLLAELPDVADALARHLSLLRALAPSPNVIKELLAKKVLSPSSSPDYAAELGNYRITGVIGRGGMGIVLRAIEVPLNRPVALKILRPELAVDRRALVRFEHEAQAAAALRHPNIVAVYACGEHDGTHYLAMELNDGPSLADLLARGSPLPTDEIRRIFGELLRGLAAAHAAGLIHRDIKSSNILLDGPNRQVKIADFGLARITASNTRVTVPQSAIGTPEYMSPEQARGDENIDHRMDLYSAGVVLYEMLTGRVPFRGDSPSALIHAILTAEPPAPRALHRSADKHLSRLALRLMAKRPEERLESAERALEAMQGRKAIRLPGSARPEDPARGMRRVVWALAGMLAMVMLAWQAYPSGQLVQVRALVRSGPDMPTVQAWYERGLWWTSLHTFAHEGAVVTCADVVRPAGSGEPFALVGVRPPYKRDSLFALDRLGRQLWSENLSDSRRWPDCGPPNEFMPAVIRAANVDGAPGDEVILIARDMIEYPTYIGVFDPIRRRFRAKYWHLGYLQGVMIAPELFGEGRPGLVVTGMNNKLDGFNSPAAGDHEPVARYDYVPIIMTLDLNAMSGERLINVPDVNGRVEGMELVLPSGYALLDASDRTVSVVVNPHTREVRKPSSEDAVLLFHEPEVIKCSSSSVLAQCIHLRIGRGSESNGGAYFRLTPGFECIHFMPSSDESSDRRVQDWSQYFKPYVQNGTLLSPSERQWDCDVQPR